MKKLLAILIILLATAPAALRAQAGHEYAPVEEKTVNYKDWTYNSLTDGKPINLRTYIQGKKLVMVVYFAPWCGNWKNEQPIAAMLYEKYKGQGFDVIGVSNYGSRDDVKTGFGGQAPYMVVSESESREARETTTHFAYRKSTGDTRKWGSPWNIFLDPAKINKTGDVLTEKAYVVNGELIEADAEKFIRERLGLDKSAAAATTTAAPGAVTPCEDTKPVVLKKP